MTSHVDINVIKESDGPPLRFQVRVREGNGESRHMVTMTTATHQRLTAGRVDAAACVGAAFRFLLDREPKEAILSRFDITVISRYFPEFSKKLPDYF